MKTLNIIIMVSLVLIGLRIGQGNHVCPVYQMPSVEYVQVILNEHGEDLEVDGVAGTKTVEAWMFHSTGWEANNERNFESED